MLNTRFTARAVLVREASHYDSESMKMMRLQLSNTAFRYFMQFYHVYDKSWPELSKPETDSIILLEPEAYHAAAPVPSPTLYATFKK
jgi:hypothetical protein